MDTKEAIMNFFGTKTPGCGLFDIFAWMMEV